MADPATNFKSPNVAGQGQASDEVDVSRSLLDARDGSLPNCQLASGMDGPASGGTD